MLFRNFTPFPHLLFESRDEQRRDFGVLVLRGTFKIVPGEPLRPVVKQEPLVMADRYFGEPGKSSIWMETNLAPYKPNSDIHINAVARAPGSKPAKQWDVGVTAGKLTKTFRVTGPRSYVKTLSLWRLTEPLEVMEVPVRYEQAFGGIYQDKDQTKGCEQNTIGCGFYGSEQLTAEHLPAPQIVPLDSPEPAFGQPIKVEGLGPILPSWKPRLKHAGTYDNHWLTKVWPNLPSDFQFDFWNSAHPDLIYPGYLDGNERINLRNLSPHGDLTFTLPAFQLGLLCRFEDGQLAPVPMPLDTLHLDLPSMEAFLVWRGAYPVTKPMRVLEARMEVPDNIKVIEKPAVPESELQPV